MRGSGESDGDLATVSRRDFLTDAVAAYDELINGTNASRIAVVGSSFGAYLGALLLPERAVEALSLRAPGLYPDEGFEEPQQAQREAALAAARSSVLKWQDNRALTSLHNFKGPVQIIESGNDKVVGHNIIVSYSEAITSDSQLTHEIVADAPHHATDRRL